MHISSLVSGPGARDDSKRHSWGGEITAPYCLPIARRAVDVTEALLCGACSSSSSGTSTADLFDADDMSVAESDAATSLDPDAALDTLLDGSSSDAACTACPLVDAQAADVTVPTEPDAGLTYVPIARAASFAMFGFQ